MLDPIIILCNYLDPITIISYILHPFLKYENILTNLQLPYYLFYIFKDLNDLKHHMLKASLLNKLLGGGERDRTDDPLLAKQVLSQLSYTPNSGGSRWT